MKRRKAIKQIGAGITAGLILPQFLGSCKKEDPGPEVPFDGTVAIIGAGAAGLYAADILHAKGISVAIYEASGQIGGRVQSLRNQLDYQQLYNSAKAPDFGADFPLEIGAEIVTGSDSIFGKIISTATVPVADMATATDKFVLSNQVKSASEWQGDSAGYAIRSLGEDRS